MSRSSVVPLLAWLPVLPKKQALESNKELSRVKAPQIKKMLIFFLVFLFNILDQGWFHGQKLTKNQRPGVSVARSNSSNSLGLSKHSCKYFFTVGVLLDESVHAE